VISVFGSEVGAEEREALAACLEDQWLGLGSRTSAFEARMRERLGLDHFLMVDSGSNALHLAVRLLDLPPGSNVILPSFTWVSCAHAVLMAGCRPVFCDVDEDTQNVTVETLRPHLDDRAAAILVVHYAGKPVDLAPILALGLPVIEDAAHAVDSRYRGRACGGHGDIGIYSFDAVKNLTTGSGGGITVRDPERRERARQLRYCGIGRSAFQAMHSDSESASRWWEQDIVEVSGRFAPSDLNAAIGLAQLDKLDRLQERRRQIWSRYQAAFRGASDVRTPQDPAQDERHSWFTYLVRVPNRDRIARAMLDAGVYTTLRFPPLHRQGIFASPARLPVTEQLAETGLNLPLHPRLTDEEVERVIDTFLAATREARAGA
jgi:aminotransferase